MAIVRSQALGKAHRVLGKAVFQRYGGRTIMRSRPLNGISTPATQNQENEKMLFRYKIAVTRGAQITFEKFFARARYKNKFAQFISLNSDAMRVLLGLIAGVPAISLTSYIITAQYIITYLKNQGNKTPFYVAYGLPTYFDTYISYDPSDGRLLIHVDYRLTKQYKEVKVAIAYTEVPTGENAIVEIPAYTSTSGLLSVEYLTQIRNTSAMMAFATVICDNVPSTNVSQIPYFHQD